MVESESTEGIEALIEEHILPKLDPDFLAYFASTQARLKAAQPQPQPTVPNPPIEHVRAHPEAYRSPCAVDASGYAGVSNLISPSRDLGVTIPVRVYHPDPMKHGAGPYPVHLNFHGGGFVLGDLTTEAALCLSMREAGVAVVDVDYRLCPETTWGKCIQDGWDVLKWVRESATALRINPASISIGGVSAGGHISLVLQHMARDAGIPLKLCMASVTPATAGLSYKYYTDSPFPSFHEFHRGPVLPWERIKYFGRLCMPPETLPALRKMWPDWWFAPLHAPDWSNLCDTFIRTAEVDPLRDEGEAYALKLVAGGNKVTVKRYLGCPHTFMYIDAMKRKHEYDRDAIAALRAAHGLC
ncbi:Alpha/Beta hydrolase protein [Chaetomidium leptoderma]|uniref:Alpha/Beta hydrolase protein n=1 Tax=Chaetomidium leptoderma TaxID=669021 RepID=A0AAN6ZWS1_9PEZI|nr:Alpha/Beta hydrolase protein [Chaetomidium leptoderma]